MTSKQDVHTESQAAVLMRTEPRPRVTRTKFGEDRTRNFQNMFADKHTNRQSDTVVAKLRLPYTGAGGAE